MNVLITGGCGFIGSNLVRRLCDKKYYKVIVYDNLSTGTLDNIEGLPIKFVKGNLLDINHLTDVMSKNAIEMVYHLAANADVRHGPEHSFKDLEQNTIATYNVLEAMRLSGVKKIAFSSTGSVYGEAKVVPTPENAPMPIQTSLYGASKVACEGLIQAYCEAYDMQSWIFRFVSILGPRYSHGHVIDFYNQLLEHPDTLDILGDGKQRKSYLHVSDCIDAMLHATCWSLNKINIFNLGTNETITVNDSIKIICNYMNVTPTLNYSGGSRGWIGDNPLIYLDTTKIRSLDWKPKYTIEESIINTVHYLHNS